MLHRQTLASGNAADKLQTVFKAVIREEDFANLYDDTEEKTHGAPI